MVLFQMTMARFNSDLTTHESVRPFQDMCELMFYRETAKRVSFLFKMCRGKNRNFMLEKQSGLKNMFFWEREGPWESAL